MKRVKNFDKIWKGKTNSREMLKSYTFTPNFDNNIGIYIFFKIQICCNLKKDLMILMMLRKSGICSI